MAKRGNLRRNTAFLTAPIRAPSVFTSNPPQTRRTSGSRTQHPSIDHPVLQGELHHFPIPIYQELFKSYPPFMRRIIVEDQIVYIFKHRPSMSKITMPNIKQIEFWDIDFIDILTSVQS